MSIFVHWNQNYTRTPDKKDEGFSTALGSLPSVWSIFMSSEVFLHLHLASGSKTSVEFYFDDLSKNPCLWKLADGLWLCTDKILNAKDSNCLVAWPYDMFELWLVFRLHIIRHPPFICAVSYLIRSCFGMRFPWPLIAKNECSRK